MNRTAAKNGTCPTLAKLGKMGVNYTRTTPSRPSESLPGLMAIVTGGTPRTVGAFYDVAWDRVLAPPSVTTGNGLAAGTCTPNKNNGTQTEYEEGDEIDQTKLNGGGPYKSPIDGGILSLRTRPVDSRSVLQAHALRAGLPVELHPHQHHLRCDPRGRRLHRLVGQARRLRRGFR